MTTPTLFSDPALICPACGDSHNTPTTFAINHEVDPATGLCRWQRVAVASLQRARMINPDGNHDRAEQWVRDVRLDPKAVAA